MRGFLANTDYDWFTFLRAISPPIDEVNFWKPGSKAGFKRLEPGEPLFFRLKSPRNAIAGFGYFAHFSKLPVSMAWEAYGIANGAATYAEMRHRLLRLRTRNDMETDPRQDFWIGCLLVNQPVFFAEEDWVRAPADWNEYSPPGNTYELSEGEGKRVWLECLARASMYRDESAVLGTGSPNLVASLKLPSGFGSPSLICPRLGQRSFRIVVLDSYDRRCAVTSERTLPALEAAHIRDYSDVQQHEITNGILFRADIHKLFDAGYVTVTPEYRFEVSRRIKEEFENGRDYYKLHGTEVRLPRNIEHHPLADAIAWHNAERFLG